MGRGFLPVLQAFNVMSDNNWRADMSRFCSATSALAPLQTSSFTASHVTFGYPCSTAGGAITALLPPANGILGKPFFFKNAVGANNLTVTAAGSDTIDGSATLVLTAGQSAVIYSDGVSKWYQVATASGGGGGGTTITVKDEGVTQSTTVTTLDFVGAGVTASGAGATATITIPGGGGGSTITVQDEGVTTSSTVTTLNFVGAGVVASGAGATATITVSGAGTGDMLKANNLSDVVNAATSFTNLQFLTSATGGVARGARTKMMEVQVSVKDFGAVGNAVTNDTAAFQAAIDYVTSLGGGTVVVPTARYMFTGTLTLKRDVSLVGDKEGPFDVQSNPCTVTIGPTLLITNTTTTFILQQTGGNNSIQNLIFAYPNQNAPTSSTIVTYPWTLKQTVGGFYVSKCLFLNSYDAIWFANGRGGVRDSVMFALHYGIKLDVVVDWNFISNVCFIPAWTYATGTSWPANMDTAMTTNGSCALYCLRADSVKVMNFGVFAYYQYGIAFDYGTTSGYTGGAYGDLCNIDLDFCVNAIHCVSTNSPGIRITNITAGPHPSVAGRGVYLPSGGTTAPYLSIVNGNFRGTWVNGLYSVVAGKLEVQNVYPFDRPGGAVTAPAIPATTVTITSAFPFSVAVYINGGTVSAVYVNGTNTGGVRGAINIPPNGTVRLDYTVVPTSWTWFNI